MSRKLPCHVEGRGRQCKVLQGSARSGKSFLVSLRRSSVVRTLACHAGGIASRRSPPVCGDSPSSPFRGSPSKTVLSNPYQCIPFKEFSRLVIIRTSGPFQNTETGTSFQCEPAGYRIASSQ